MAASLIRNNTNAALGFPQNGSMSPLLRSSNESERGEKNTYTIAFWKGTLFNMEVANNDKEISEKLSVNINDSGKTVDSFNTLNRFFKSLPLRNNSLLYSSLGIINVKINFYEVVSEKFGNRAASKTYSFPPANSITTSEV